jgi:hypothetical protein
VNGLFFTTCFDCWLDSSFACCAFLLSSLGVDFLICFMLFLLLLAAPLSDCLLFLLLESWILISFSRSFFCCSFAFSFEIFSSRLRSGFFLAAAPLVFFLFELFVKSICSSSDSVWTSSASAALLLAALGTDCLFVFAPFLILSNASLTFLGSLSSVRAFMRFEAEDNFVSFFCGLKS